MDNIEEVKNYAAKWFDKGREWGNFPMTKETLAELEKEGEEIYRLFEPAGAKAIKPARLLTYRDWERINQNCGFDVVDIIINLDNRFSKTKQMEMIVERCNRTAKAQDAKTAPSKDKEFEKKCKECEYDPQAERFGWFLEHGWLPPAGVEKKDAEIAELNEVYENMFESYEVMVEVLEDQHQQEVEEIFKLQALKEEYTKKEMRNEQKS